MVEIMESATAAWNQSYNIFHVVDNICRLGVKSHVPLQAIFDLSSVNTDDLINLS